MKNTKKLSVARLKTILSRQLEQAWGADYLPAILATREEAPGGSRPSRLQSPKFGREMHFLSIPERSVSLLALFHNRLIYLKEQLVLWWGPRSHPLDGHPSAHGLQLPPLKGTIDVARRMDCLDLQPQVWQTDESGERYRIPYPWVGDLLLFMTDDVGPYCVNWNVKATPAGFVEPFSPDGTLRDSEKALRKARLRPEIEVGYYADAGIRTECISGNSIDAPLVRNLARMHSFLEDEISLQDEELRDAHAALTAQIAAGQTPFQTWQSLMMRHQIVLREAEAIFYQALWNRLIRIDLFRPILADKPCLPESIDPLVRYGTWFRR